VGRLIARLRRQVLGISPEEATFGKRGFRGGDEQARARLERIGATFLEGYHAALEADDDSLGARLNTVEAEWRGFAFEGAAMGLALLDFMSPWKKNRLQSFLRGPGAAHVYMIHVGAGWALARLPVRPERFLKRLDPLLGWLAIDGYGFHEGYFGGPGYFAARGKPARLAGEAAQVFDQGLGRSLWFVEGADVQAIAATVAAFPESRQADLWSGIGLACAYAGGQDRANIEALRREAGRFQAGLAQGAAFAAKARQRAANLVPHTDLACQVICGVSAAAAAEVTDITLQALEAERSGVDYAAWRRRIQASFAREVIANDWTGRHI
jgi:enediyne biosynthesis protein E3